ncbi:oxidase [Lithospermum erythrorhizon]|uniref:Laccase n=1 Tax=Lithospermum erythrorhizon TaxID=34254 RepID=A0AAV3R831_LITER
MKQLFLQLVGFLLVLFCCLLPSTHATIHHPRYVVKEANFTRLCKSKSIWTVNGEFPGPTLYVEEGDTILVTIVNQGPQNITIHWHGVKQIRYPWSDGPEYITQCPIQPGANFSQRIVLSDEIGTLWWHAHSDWSRATVHGALVVKPKNGTTYPFPKPQADVPIIIAEWFRADVQAILEDFLRRGGDPNVSDAYTINGQPGVLYPCSETDVFKISVEQGKTYLIRMVNAVMNNIMFFSVAKHQLTVVGADGAYLKPFNTSYIAIAPGQTMDFLLFANQNPDHYCMASKPYQSLLQIQFDNTTTTAVVEYVGNYTASSPPLIPRLPVVNDTMAVFNYTSSLRSLASKDHPVDVPKNVTKNLFFTLAINSLPCPDSSCDGPNGSRFAASVSNLSWVEPQISILQAYYNNIAGVYNASFPRFPELFFNFTSQFVPIEFQLPRQTTEVKVLEYNSSVELILQGTNVVGGIDHPMHLHGHSFYVVGEGLGNFNKTTDPLRYNLVDPPYMNTFVVPRSGWAAIRFIANNPGVWLLHCHFERHITWGMEMVFIVKNGPGSSETILPPPPDMPPC